LVFALFFVTAPFLAGLFSSDPAVTTVLIRYLRIVSLGYGMMEVNRYCGFFLIGIHKPFAASCLTFIRLAVLLIPLSYLGARFWGLTGLFVGRVTSDLLSGAIGWTWTGRVAKKLPTNHRSQ